MTPKRRRQVARQGRIKQAEREALARKKTKAGAIHTRNPDYPNKGLRRIMRANAAKGFDV